MALSPIARPPFTNVLLYPVVPDGVSTSATHNVPWAQGTNTLASERIIAMYDYEVPNIEELQFVIALNCSQAAATGNGTVTVYVSPLSVTETVGAAPSASAYAITDSDTVTQGAPAADWTRVGAVLDAALTVIRNAGGFHLIIAGTAGQATKTLTVNAYTSTVLTATVRT